MKEYSSKISKRKLNKTLIIMIYIYFALAFIEPYINTSGITGSITRYYIIVLLLFILLSKTRFNFKKYHLFIFFWLMYKILTLIWSPDASRFQGQFFSHVAMVTLLIIFSAIDLDKRSINGIIKTNWISSGILGLLSLFFNKSYLDAASGRSVLYIFGQEQDPNFQSALLLLGIAISLYFLLKSKYKTPSLIILIVNTYSIFLSGSRGGLVSLIILAFIFIILNIKNNNFKKTIFVMSLSIITVFIMTLLVNHYLPGNIYNRLFNFASYEDGAGRLFLWENGLELYSKGLNPLFGAGWGAFWGYNNSFMYIHNTFLSMLIEVGLFGFLLFYGPIAYMTIRNLKSKEYVSVLIIIAAMAPSFFLDSISGRFFWNSIMILYILYNYVNKNKTMQSNMD